MEKTSFAGYKSQSPSLKVKSEFMHDNASSHVSKHTRESFEHKIFIGEKIISWPLSSSGLNPIETLLLFMKMKSYKYGKQYSIKTDFGNK